MGMPAARLTDMHVCPAFTGPVPHVGGPISGPGCPTVLIGKMPAARATDMAVCVGPPDTIAKGSATVLIGKMPAARIGDSCAHGGTIVAGKNIEPEEIRGSDINGGESRSVSKGDVIVVPHNTPHWFKEVKGPLNYYVVKVRAAN